ncbi:MAG: galactokinase [Gammaproteobacteria bacterium]
MERLEEQFVARFSKPSHWTIRSPGRVNLIGDHTDYNDGFVLPMAIEHAVWLIAAPRDEAGINVYSANLDRAEEFGGNGEKLSVSETWTDYLKGVVAEFQSHGMDMPGLEILVWSDVPMGCGLSSSAALQIGMARLLQLIEPERVPDGELAALCQTAEHNFTGMPAGIMDQFCVAYAKNEHLMYLDCRSLDVQHIPLRDDRVAVLIINSKVSRELRDGSYAKRRASCEEACGILGVSHLRDVTSAQVEEAKEELGDLRYRRARHVTSEDERTAATVEAIANKDWREVGRLMHESHLSLSNDYETSCPELDIINNIAHDMGQDSGLYGARITGGGFGGCAVALIEREHLESIVTTLSARYLEATGIELEAYSSSPSFGARVTTQPETPHGTES